jgi:hypothetical protein
MKKKSPKRSTGIFGRLRGNIKLHKIKKAIINHIKLLFPKG